MLVFFFPPSVSLPPLCVSPGVNRQIGLHLGTGSSEVELVNHHPGLSTKGTHLKFTLWILPLAGVDLTLLETKNNDKEFILSSHTVQSYTDSRIYASKILDSKLEVAVFVTELGSLEGLHRRFACYIRGSTVNRGHKTVENHTLLHDWPV